MPPQTRAQCYKKRKPAERELLTAGVVGESGFEPLKSSTTDLQSAPFGHSGTLPYKPLPVWLGMSMRLRLSASGAGERTRTPDLLITNQLLYQLSYTSTGAAFWRQEKQLFPFPRAARPIERPDSLIIIPCAAGKVKMISKKISLFFSRRSRGGAREKFPKKQWTFFYFVLQ